MPGPAAAEFRAHLDTNALAPSPSTLPHQQRRLGNFAPLRDDDHRKAQPKPVFAARRDQDPTSSEARRQAAMAALTAAEERGAAPGEAAGQNGQLADPLADDERAALEDDPAAEDDRFLSEYRRKRVAALEAEARAAAAARGLPRWGSLDDVGPSDWSRLVTHAPPRCWVLVALLDDGGGGCPLSRPLEEALSELARRYPHGRFLRGRAKECAPGMPQGAVPTVLLYLGGLKRAELVGAARLGAAGSGCPTPEELALRLNAATGHLCAAGDDRVGGWEGKEESWGDNAASAARAAAGLDAATPGVCVQPGEEAVTSARRETRRLVERAAGREAGAGRLVIGEEGEAGARAVRGGTLADDESSDFG